jgi:MSHA biogenesis protein MshQ
MTKRLVVLILLLCVLVPDGQAATCTSRQSGNWSISSTWNCGSGSSNGPPASSDSAVISTYTVSLSNSPSVAAVTVNSGATLQQTGFSNRTLTVSGDFVNYGTLVDGSSGSLTLSVGGNLTNAATAFTVDALTVTGSTTSSSSLIVKGTFTTYGDLTVNGGTYSAGSVVFAGSGTQAATFYGLASSVGNLTVNSGSTVSSTNWSTLTVTGNLVNSGSISLPNTAWTFAGSLAQTLSGNAFSFYNLTLSNAAGLTLGMSPSVSNLLTLTSGIVTTGSNILTASANCPGSLAGYSGTSYVNGNLRLTYAAWPVTCVYPVGTSTAYAPITVSIPWFWGIAGGTLTGSTTNGEHPQIASASINSARDANRYWTLGATGDTMSSLPTGGSYDLSLAFVAADVDSGATVANFKVGTYASSAWGTLSGSASGTTATATGLTSFGSYATGEPGSTPSTCNPPAGAPSGVTCYCDNFARSTLNPSTIFSSNWAVSSGSGSFGVPKIVNPGYLRLTDASGNVSTAATVPGIFPAAGNYISVEFKNYAYYGSGADGIVMTLSNYATPAVPGAYGGSLGYAQQTGINGFAGGWIGVALDEHGNYSNPTEGRVLGPGFYAQSVGARGPGSGTNGYRWMGGTTAVGSVDNSGSTSAAPGNQYQVIVDARNSSTNSILVWVNRDSTTKNGTNYTALFGGTGGFNAYTEAAYALSQGWTTSVLPANWQISFTGSTGGSTNIHEISDLKICAQAVLPPTAGSSSSNFNAIDDAYGTSVSYITAQQGHIYTKLAGTNFNLNVIAFTNSGTAINTVYANTVVVQLIDDSGGTSCNASAATCGSCAKPVLASQTMTYTSSNAGQMVTPTAFNLSSAYSRVIARICQGSSCSGATTVSCSSDAFSVRPTNLTVSSTATQAGTTGTPKFKAGTDSFTMTATANAANYTGMPKISTSATQANGGGGTLGSLIPSAFASASGTTSSSTTSFTYSEVGNFQFLGYSPSSDTTSSRGVYDDSWTATTDGPTNDCVSGSYANTKNAGGKYGCNFGLSANSGTFGRFYPDHFRASTIFVPRSDLVRTTTGSISAGSTTLTVASAIGIAAGNTLVVLGAGVAGMPLQTTVSSVSGTTVALAAGASTTVSSATVYDTTSAASSTFSYMGEPMLVLTSLVAQNGSGGTTTNYITSGTATLNFAKLSAATLTSCSSWFVAAASSSCSTTNPQYFGFGAIDGTVTPLTSGLAMYFAPSSANWVSGVSTFTTNLTLARNPSSPAGPYEAFRLGEVPADDDGVTVLASALNLDADASGTSERQLVATGKERYGRLRLSNAYGSELLGLQVPVRAEYYAGGVWVLNSIDSSTSIANPKNDIALGNCTGTLSCATGGNMDPATHLPTTAVTLNAGINTITLAKPTCTSGPCPAGGLDLALTLGSSGTNDNCVSPALSAATSGASLSWLQYAWCTGKTDPNARATFGVAKNRFIYLRERY